MLIRNVKSFADLEKKKNLQAQLLQIAIENEEVLENRVKDYKNPNKPPPVPPQYKSTAEIQKDTTLQQKEVVNNLLTINGVDATLALGVSQEIAQLPNGVGNYLIFNKNFPVIKKRLEDISKSAYGVDTFMNKIEEVLQQIEIGTLYNTTGGVNATSAFSQGVGAGQILGSGQTIEDYTTNGPSSTYGLLLENLTLIKEIPQSPLADDPEFNSIITIIQSLMTNSPPEEDLVEFDAIELLEKQKLQKEIDRLVNIRGIPNRVDVLGITQSLNPTEYEAQLSQAIELLNPQLPKTFTSSYADLTKMVKKIKEPNITIPDLGRLKDRISKSLEERRAVQTGLTTQLIKAKDKEIERLRKIQTDAVEESFRKVLRDPKKMAERLLSNRGNPYSNELYGNNMINYSPTLDGQPPDQANPANIIVEVVAHSKYENQSNPNGILNLPYLVRGKIVIPLIDGEGNEIQRADGTRFKTIEDFISYSGVELDRYFFRNLLQIYEPSQQEIQDYENYVVARRAYDEQEFYRSKPKKYQTLFRKQNPSFVPLPYPVPIPQPNYEVFLTIGSEESVRAKPTFKKDLLRLNLPRKYRERSDIEINALRELLANDPFYDPEAQEAQRLIPTQGYGVKRGKGYTIYDLGSDIKKFFGGAIPKEHRGRGFMDVMKQRSDDTNRAIAKPFIDANEAVKATGRNAGNAITKFFGGNLGNLSSLIKPDIVCPAVYDPVMKNGKMYSNACEASAYGGMLKPPRMCPQNFAPVRAKDGKIYGNRCKALEGGGADENYKGNPYAIDGMGFMNRRIKIGKGIAVEEQPRYRTFGKYIIHIPFLENENVLNFKFPSMGSIPTLKPVSIDDNFKDFILDILNSGQVNQKHYDSLTEAEKAHFNKAVKGAGLTNALKFKVDDTIDDKKDLKRIDVLVGQIIAGNDNDKVMKEAKELIKKCVANGSMTKHKGMDLLFQIE